MTDAPEYAVSATVHVAAMGFAPGDPVTISIHGATFPDFNVVAGPTTVAADDAGRVLVDWTMPEGVGVNFIVRATAASGTAIPAEFNRAAAITTDHRARNPGDIGLLTGQGFTPGGNVMVVIEGGGLLDGSGIVAADDLGRISAPFALDIDAPSSTHRIAALGLGPGALVGPMTELEAAGTLVTDDGGLDDVPGDSDLLYYRFQFRRDLSPRVLDLTIGWDSTWFEGNDRAAILLDANRNGMIDRAVYAEVQGEPIEPFKIASVFACDDTSAVTCNARTYVRDISWQAWQTVRAGALVQNLPVSLASLDLPPDGEEPIVINVCSVFDCVVTPGSGFLSLEHTVPAGNGTGTFTVNLASGAARDGRSEWSLTPHLTRDGAWGSLPFISMPPGTYLLNDLVPEGWQLVTAECRPAGYGVPTTTLPVTGPAVVTLQNVVITPGVLTRCKFTTRVPPGSTNAP
ncbi:MAG: hypothetical protein R2712_03530 [Vicinamibacterales bacterium]